MLCSNDDVGAKRISNNERPASLLSNSLYM